MDKKQVSKEELFTSVCPFCKGSGEKVSECAYCKGTKQLTTFQNKYLYWGLHIDAAHAKRRIFEERVASSFLMAAILFSIIGKITAFIFILNELPQNRFPLSLFVYEAEDIRLFIFWLSALMDLYIFYRLTRTLQSRRSLTKEFALSSGESSAFDVSKWYSANAREVIERAWLLAKKYNQKSLMPVHILASLLETRLVSLLFARIEANASSIVDGIASAMRKLRVEGSDVLISENVLRILSLSFVVALNDRKQYVDETSLLRALVENDEFVRELFFEVNIDAEKVKNVILWIDVERKILKGRRYLRSRARFRPKGKLDRAMTALATPFLDAVSTDLTFAAKQGVFEPLVGRQEETSQVWRILASEMAVALVGPNGSGKTEIIHGIAELMVEEEVPEFLSDKRLLSLSIDRIVSGATPSEAAERLLEAVDEAARAGNIALVVENVHLLIGISTGASGSLGLLDILGSVISKRRIPVIVTSEPMSYDQGKNEATLGELFPIVRVEEPDENLTIQILESKTIFLEGQFGVFFTYDSIKLLQEFSERYFPQGHMPKAAVEILREIAIFVSARSKEKRVVTSSDVETIISSKVNMPVLRASESESKKLLSLEAAIHKRFIDQDEAVVAVSNALRRARTNLSNPHRPIANFLFLGPTGVGKTELAKTVADIYFGTAERMIRLDMSEYQDSGASIRLIGGRGEKGILTSAVADSPFSLILLDEIEKSHRDVLNIFLQVMDDGRLTDGTGMTIQFTNCIIIATSNAGSQFIMDSLHQDMEPGAIAEELREGELRHYFLPEFLNRFDGIIVFRPLTINDVKAIARLMFKELQERIEKEHGVSLFLNEPSLSRLAEKAYRPEYGARELRRVIQDDVESAFSKLVLSGSVKRRDSVEYTEDGAMNIIKAKEL